MKATYYILSFAALLSGSLISCTKDALDQKPDISIAEPSTIADYQQLLDGVEGGAIGYAPGLYSYRSLGDYLSDEYTVTDGNYTTYFSGAPYITGVLTWNKNMFTSLTSLDEWNKQYQVILNTNLVLEGLAKITTTPANLTSWNLAEGMALFIRGQLFYNLAQFWAKPYNTATAAADPGIVLRTHSDANIVSVRSSVQETYNQILADLKGSVPLLPNTSSQNTQLSKVRPSKAAAYGMLARTYLAMGDSVNVEKYADSALQLYSTLMDYNTVSSFSNFNAETLYTSIDQSGTIGSTYGLWNMDTALINSYDANDLRKTLYFYNSSYAGGYVFEGDYSGYYMFTGIATDELYLLRAEGNARLGNTAKALSDLNTLLINRYQTGAFVPRTAIDASDALVQVIAERRKELVARGCRWTDLRRLNTDSRFAKTLSRTVLGKTYTLPPNDSRYTLQIPSYIISASNGSITQNP